jgi:hypothetical protein
MKHSTRSRLFLLAIVLAVAANANAGIKCWTNKEGVKECGNTVPPEYAQQAHDEKSSTGMTIKHTGRSKTPEEIANERSIKEAEDKKQAEAKAIADKQAAKDKVLLATFSSEDDLALARDGQIANVNSQVKLAESRISKLQKALDQLITKAADRERRSQKIPPEITKEIGNLREQIKDQKNFIVAKGAEAKTINAKFDADVTRFRELKTGATSH